MTVIDPAAGKAVRTYVAGRPVLVDGRVAQTGGTILTTAEGEPAARGAGLPVEVIDLTNSKLYANYSG